jgi:hypothetical protein
MIFLSFISVGCTGLTLTPMVPPFRFGFWEPAGGGGDNFAVIRYLFRQEGFLQVPGLYLFEEIGVLFEIHGGLVLRNDNTGFFARTKLFEFDGNRGQVAVPG